MKHILYVALATILLASCERTVDMNYYYAANDTSDSVFISTINSNDMRDYVKIAPMEAGLIYPVYIEKLADGTYGKRNPETFSKSATIEEVDTFYITYKGVRYIETMKSGKSLLNHSEFTYNYDGEKYQFPFVSIPKHTNACTLQFTVNEAYITSLKRFVD